MNQNNYASFEASRRLYDAGIVLETDFYWYVYNEDMCRSLIAADKAIPAPYLVNRASVRTRIGSIPTAYVPAPSMAEVWRELPKQENSVRYGAFLELSKTIDFQGNELTYAGYLRDGIASCDYTSTNPTDALIDLLIHIKGLTRTNRYAIKCPSNNGGDL